MFQVDEKIEVRGYIGGTFLATIDGILTSLPINVETKYGIITKVIPGPRLGTEYSYMIKFMCYTFPIEVDEDYITKFKHCDDDC